MYFLATVIMPNLVSFAVNFLDNHADQQSEISRQNLEAVILGASSVPLASPESPSDINDDGDALLLGGGGEAPACPADALSLQTTPDTEESSSSQSAFGERGTFELSKISLLGAVIVSIIHRVLLYSK